MEKRCRPYDLLFHSVCSISLARGHVFYSWLSLASDLFIDVFYWLSFVSLLFCSCLSGAQRWRPRLCCWLARRFVTLFILSEVQLRARRWGRQHCNDAHSNRLMNFGDDFLCQNVQIRSFDPKNSTEASSFWTRWRNGISKTAVRSRFARDSFTNGK